MEPECVAFILQIAMQNMRKMENGLMKHVNDISDQLDNKSLKSIE
jgi:hypothetical protein